MEPQNLTNYQETVSESEIAFVIFLSIISVIACFAAAFWILPENCNLFSDNIPSGLACCDFNWKNSEPCAVCREQGIARVASIIAGLGLCALLIPFGVFALKNRRAAANEETKIFS